MHLLPRTACTFVVGMSCALGTATSADVRFEEQLLVADATTASLTISPCGVHVAAVITKGCRQTVVFSQP